MKSSPSCECVNGWGLANPEVFEHPLMQQPLAKLPKDVPLAVPETPLLDQVVLKFPRVYPGSFDWFSRSAGALDWYAIGIQNAEVDGSGGVRVTARQEARDRIRVHSHFTFLLKFSGGKSHGCRQ